MNTIERLQAENQRLHQELEECKELIDAIRKGRIDALVISGGKQEAVYTLKGANYTYRVLIENMNEGALILSEVGTILYCNRRFGQLLQIPTKTLTGSAIERLIALDELARFKAFLENVPASGVKSDFHLISATGITVPCLISINPLSLEEFDALCMVVTDLSEQKKGEETLKKKNTQLEQRTTQLQRMTSELTRAEKRERKRVSHMLHDGLQQYLVSAKLQLGGIAEQMNGRSLKKEIAEVEELLFESIQVTRSLSTELSPPILYQGGLREVLVWLADWVQQLHGLEVELSVQPEVEVTEDVKIFAFEAVRELLFNAVKHAKVSRASLEVLRLDADRLKITVRDEGVGFNPDCLMHDESCNGLGLLSIRERVEFLTGALEVHSQSGKGSRFVLIVPTQIHNPSKFD